MIEQADLLIRMIAIGSSLMLLALLIEGEVRKGIKISLVGLVIGAVGYLINSTPLIGSSGPIDPWVDLVSLPPPFWVWLFSRRLFEREPPQRGIQLAVLGLVLSWFLGDFFEVAAMPAFYAIHLISLALIADLLRVALVDREDDLVEKRRIIRLVLPLLVAGQAGGILIYELLTANSIAIPWVQLVNSVLILLLLLFSGLALLRTDPELLVESQADVDSAAEPEALDLSPSEAVLHDKLKQAMADGIYREQGLTIAGLSDALDTPEHRLRSLINQRLGYRNFSAYLNRHRIAEARQKLSSKQDVDLPILTIAMDLGYNSLPTFNRAFRAETSTSPSEFRRLAFSESGGDDGEDAVETVVQN